MPFEELRASERFNCEAPVILENCHTGESYGSTMYNYSRGGMYLESNHYLKPGSEVRIVAERSPNNPNLTESCPAKIVWCREIHGAVVLYNYGLGAKYDPSIKLSNCINGFKVINGGATKNTV